MLSHIQNKILAKVLRSEHLKYSEIKPKNVTNDLYNYHLKFLLEKGYVQKKDTLYSLTNFGKKYVQQLDVKGTIKDYFKFSVLSYVVRESNGKEEILMHKRLRHPYYGDIASISGKVLYGEKVEDAATRKLQEETGLLCENFKLFGVHRKIRKDVKGKLFEDTLYHCCIGYNPTGNLLEKSEFGENMWMNFDEAQELIKKNVVYTPLLAEVYQKIERKEFELFYFQEEQVLKKM